MAFDLEQERDGEQARLRLVGSLISGESQLRLREVLQQLVDDGVRSFALELSRLTYLDSAGLGELVNSLKQVTALGGTLVVLDPSPRVDDVLRITGLDRVLRASPSTSPRGGRVGAVGPARPEPGVSAD